MTPVKELTYTQAITELEGILRHMQSDECDIDRLAALTRRATELIGECLPSLAPSMMPGISAITNERLPR